MVEPESGFLADRDQCQSGAADRGRAGAAWHRVKHAGEILRPMRQIQTGIARQLEQEGRLESRGAWLPQKERGEIQIPGDGRYGIGGKAIGKGEKECLQADKGILSLNPDRDKDGLGAEWRQGKRIYEVESGNG